MEPPEPPLVSKREASEDLGVPADILEAMYSKYEGKTSGLIGSILRGVDVANAAHTLKGSAGNLRLHRLELAALEIEKGVTAARVARLVSVWRNTVDELKNETAMHRDAR